MWDKSKIIHTIEDSEEANVKYDLVVRMENSLIKKPDAIAFSVSRKDLQMIVEIMRDMK